MYLSVQARSHEIALRRALGTSRPGIARLFVLEGAIIGIAGGAAGAALGTVAVLVATGARGWDPVLPAGIAPIGIGLGIATGLISSLPPAWIAARKEPAVALRD
jgi:ABC-type antimicrobial peptide transport system permease subunit